MSDGCCLRTRTTALVVQQGATDCYQVTLYSACYAHGVVCSQRAANFEASPADRRRRGVCLVRVLRNTSCSSLGGSITVETGFSNTRQPRVRAAEVPRAAGNKKNASSTRALSDRLLNACERPRARQTRLALAFDAGCRAVSQLSRASFGGDLLAATKARWRSPPLHQQPPEVDRTAC